MAAAEESPTTPDADVIVCDVGALVNPDASTVDALARLALTARRLGCQVWLRNASSELRELLSLVGLGDVVPCYEDLRDGPRGETEDREQPRGVEERVDRDDPTV